MLYVLKFLQLTGLFPHEIQFLVPPQQIDGREDRMNNIVIGPISYKLVAWAILINGSKLLYTTWSLMTPIAYLESKIYIYKVSIYAAHYMAIICDFVITLSFLWFHDYLAKTLNCIFYLKRIIGLRNRALGFTRFQKIIIRFTILSLAMNSSILFFNLGWKNSSLYVIIVTQWIGPLGLSIVLKNNFTAMYRRMIRRDGISLCEITATQKSYKLFSPKMMSRSIKKTPEFLLTRKLIAKTNQVLRYLKELMDTMMKSLSFPFFGYLIFCWFATMTCIFVIVTKVEADFLMVVFFIALEEVSAIIVVTLIDLPYSIMKQVCK